MDYYLPIQVRFADTDAQGHVFFGTYLTYFDEAVSGLLRALGFSYASLKADGVEMVYAHAECDYLASAVFEETLHVYARVTRIGETSITIECEARRATSGEAVARGRLVNVVVDARRVKTRVPENLRQAVARANEPNQEALQEEAV